MTFHQTMMQKTKILKITANTLIFNTQFCTKSNSLLSNVKSTRYHIPILTAKTEDLEKSIFHYRQKPEYSFWLEIPFYSSNHSKFYLE